MKHFVLFWIFGAFSLVATKSISASGHSPKADLRRAYACQSAEKYDSAIYFFKKASQTFKATKQWEKYVEAVTGINRGYVATDRIKHVETLAKEVLKLADKGKVAAHSVYIIETYDQLAYVKWYAQGNFPEALKYLDKAIKICDQANFNKTEQLVHIYTDYGYVYGYTGKYGQSSAAFKKALDVALKNYGKGYKKIGDFYSNLAFPYFQEGEWGKAAEMLKEAIRLNIKNRGAQDISVMKAYNNLGSLYLRNFDNDQANIYLHKALSLLRQHYGENNRSVGIAYMNLGSSYANKMAFQEGLDYNLKAIENLRHTIGPKNPYLSIILCNNAVCYNGLGRPGKARESLAKALSLNRELYGGQNPEVLRTYNIIAGIELKNNNPDEAFKALIKAKEIGKKALPAKHVNKAETFAMLGEYYLRKANYPKSLQSVQQALTAIVPTFNDTSVSANPKPAGLFPNHVLIDALTEKTRVLYAAFEAVNNDSLLSMASKNAKLTDHAIDLLRTDYQMPNSRQLLIERVLPFYETAVDIALAQYDKTRDREDLEQAFNYVEKSKSILLMETLKANSRVKYAGIPDTISKKDENLRQEIKFYREQLMQARANSDSVKIAEDENQFFAKKRDYDLLVENLKKEYPDYYHVQHQITYLTMAKIQKTLAPHESLLEFYEGRNASYTFYISSKQMGYLKNPGGDSLNNEATEFIAGLRHGRFDRLHAFGLYSQLLKPALDVLPKQSVRELTIVPGGILNYLPFEALLQSSPKSSAKNDFFIKDCSVHYLHSASLLKKHRKESAMANRAFLGFAPKFSKKSNPLLATRSASDTLLASKLVQLPMARKEVEESAKVWGGVYYVDDQATEANFKQFAPGAGIIHLATHAVLDDKNPLYSKLVFSPGKDTLEDGLLNTYELYNIHLNAQLVCLSACNTGLGKLKSGQGVVGLAQGFLYAGVPNVMMSLWSVPDKSTSQIMQYFYVALKSGKGKADALREAKLKYLAHADENTSDPYYWAAFTLIGDNQPIDQEFAGWETIFIWGCVLTMALVFGGFYYHRKQFLVII